MANSIEYAEKYQSFIDEELEAGSYTEWMTPNSEEVDYSGGKDIKIATLEVSGLGDYDSTGAAGNKYPNGSVKQVWNSYTMEMDRAIRFELDRMDPSDSGFISTMENIFRVFTKKQLAPEQDIYRFNKLYSTLNADTNWKPTHVSTTTGLTAANAVSTIMGLTNITKDDVGEDMDYIGFIARKNEQAFRDAAKNNNNSITFNNTITINGITYTGVMVVNELPCIFVPSRRLQTTIQINDGRTAGQEAGGISIDPASKQIEFLLTNADGPMAVGKLNSAKQFTADQNQLGDDDLAMFRYIYDCWLLKNKVVTTAACIAQ